MKISFFKKIAACILTFSIVMSSSVEFAINANAVPDEYHDDWLHVNENAEIVDMYGNPVWLTGCNWFGYNVGSQVFDGVWSQNMHDMLRQIADHGFNFLRVPVSTELLLQWKNGDPDPATPKVNEYSNPELTVEGIQGGTVKYSFDIWNQAVEWCRELGIKIMIDIHSAETSTAGHQVSLWYTDKFSTEDWFEALGWFADYYKDDDTILAIDLKNEPHGKADVPSLMAKWDGTTDPNNWKYAAECAAAKVMEKNPNLLVMVEGVEVYPKEGYDWTAPAIDWATNTEYYHGTWWGGNFRGAKEYPIDLKEHQSQLVYSPHDYGPLVWKQKWFYDGFTKDSLLEDCWYDNWFYLLEEKEAPLFMGEWGGFIDEQHDPDGTNTKWMAALRDFMIENTIHHTFWCFNENSGDTGGLVYDNFGKWDEDKYAFVKPSLWQDDSGNFISLDHKITLGSNGISLGDYYSEIIPTESDTTEHPANIILGDVNEDSIVNIFDSILLRRYILNSVFLINHDNSDMNDDGNVNISDLTALNSFLLYGK